MDKKNYGRMAPETRTYFEIQLDQLFKEHYLPEYYYVQVRQSKAFMEKYLSEKIELEKIASSAFMSRFHYTRIFKRVYGLSPRQYLKDLRINKAKELLKQGLNISQVCFEVGYDSLPTFCNAFKKATGYSPGEYQNLNKSNLE
jgi:AraC-like DNA-binding protein